jgi:hypothetical protein
VGRRRGLLLKYPHGSSGSFGPLNSTEGPARVNRSPAPAGCRHALSPHFFIVGPHAPSSRNLPGLRKQPRQPEKVSRRRLTDVAHSSAGPHGETV